MRIHNRVGKHAYAYLLFLAGYAVIGIYAFSNAWVPFVPTTVDVRGNLSFQEHPELLTPDNIRLIQHELDKRHIEYRVWGRELYVRRGVMGSMGPVVSITEESILRDQR